MSMAIHVNTYIVRQEFLIDNATSITLLNVDENVARINVDIIPSDQRMDIGQYRIRRDSEKRLIARSFLYESVRERFGVQNFDLGFGVYEKPFLKNYPDIHFSLSYSKDFILVGVSQGRRIGVDIEYNDQVLDVREIAPDIMCAPELAYFCSRPGDVEQRRFFFDLFSRKESIIKAYGTGLYFPVRDLNILGPQFFSNQGMVFECSPLNTCLSNSYSFAICREVSA